MAKLDELTEEVEAIQEEPEDKILVDLIDGIKLIKQSRNLFSVIGDPELCRNVTNRERTMIDKILEKMKWYLDEMEAGYEE